MTRADTPLCFSIGECHQKFGFEIIPHRDGLKIADIKFKI